MCRSKYAAFGLILTALLQASVARVIAAPQMAYVNSPYVWIPERQLSSPVYDSVAYNNYLNYIGTYGGNPWSFTPYAPLYVNPFSNPSFAENFPQAIKHSPFGRQLLNYMSFMNPLLYLPQGHGNTWDMGDFGLGSSNVRLTPPVSAEEAALSAEQAAAVAQVETDAQKPTL